MQFSWYFMPPKSNPNLQKHYHFVCRNRGKVSIGESHPSQGWSGMLAEKDRFILEIILMGWQLMIWEIESRFHTKLLVMMLLTLTLEKPWRLGNWAIRGPSPHQISLIFRIPPKKVTIYPVKSITHSNGKLHSLHSIARDSGKDRFNHGGPTSQI